jgi:CheY-like chemotaxis protein
MKTTVLVVDDDADFRLVVCAALTTRGYAVLTAANGQEALGQLRRSSPAVLLLDLQMPVLDGWVVLRQLRAQQLPVRVVVISGETGAAWAEALQLADGSLPKPFRTATLFALLDRLLAPPPHCVTAAAGR